MSKKFTILAVLISIMGMEFCHGSQEERTLGSMKLSPPAIPLVVRRQTADSLIKPLTAPTPFDLETKLLETYREKAKDGTEENQLKLACLLLQPQHLISTDDMKNEAYRTLLSMQDHGNPTVVFNLAHCLQYGNGVEATKLSKIAALTLYRVAAAKHYLPAKVMLAYCLFNKIGCRGTIGDSIEALGYFVEAADQGSQFSCLFLGYHSLYAVDLEENQLKRALHYFLQVEDKYLVTPMIAVVYLLQGNRSKALEHLLLADDYYKNWLSPIPVNEGFIEYLKYKVSKENLPKAKTTKQKGKTGKEKAAIAQEQLKNELISDLTQTYNQYVTLRHWLYDLSQDKSFPRSKDFHIDGSIAELKRMYKSFEKDWKKGNNNDELRLYLTDFMLSLHGFEEKCFLSEQRVRNKSIKDLLAKKLRDLRLEAEN